ncbi:MAG: hypothetical protein IT384_16560 [Deltaproteobacteria bacterium]|nr:hypothetical protein [Deltaproteobacteria bacterium]
MALIAGLGLAEGCGTPVVRLDLPPEVHDAKAIVAARRGADGALDRVVAFEPGAPQALEQIASPEHAGGSIRLEVVAWDRPLERLRMRPGHLEPWLGPDAVRLAQIARDRRQQYAGVFDESGKGGWDPAADLSPDLGALPVGRPALGCEGARVTAQQISDVPLDLRAGVFVSPTTALLFGHRVDLPSTLAQTVIAVVERDVPLRLVDAGPPLGAYEDPMKLGGHWSGGSSVLFSAYGGTATDAVTLIEVGLDGRVIQRFEIPRLPDEQLGLAQGASSATLIYGETRVLEWVSGSTRARDISAEPPFYALLEPDRPLRSLWMLDLARGAAIVGGPADVWNVPSGRSIRTLALGQWSTEARSDQPGIERAEEIFGSAEILVARAGVEVFLRNPEGPSWVSVASDSPTLLRLDGGALPHGRALTVGAIGLMVLIDPRASQPCTIGTGTQHWLNDIAVAPDGATALAFDDLHRELRDRGQMLPSTLFWVDLPTDEAP